MSTLFNRRNIVLLLVLLVATLFGFAMIPAGSKLPVHWNMYGVVDRFATRNQALIQIPLVAALATALLAGAARIFGSSRQLALSLSVVLALFVAIQAMTVLIGMGHSIDVPRMVTIVSALGLIAIGNMLPKSGPRTRSLNDPRHRYQVLKVTGILMILAGFVVFVTALTAGSSRWLFVMQMGCVAAAVTSGALYAYRVGNSNST